MINAILFGLFGAALLYLLYWAARRGTFGRDGYVPRELTADEDAEAYQLGYGVGRKFGEGECRYASDEQEMRTAWEEGFKDGVSDRDTYLDTFGGTAEAVSL